MKHLPGLDGLRGVAVLGVLLFHADGLLPGGYLGVDLFFVLSGFLITSILVEEHRETGAIDLRGFWVRRARRLLPPVLSLMPAVALYAATLAAPKELAALRGDGLATLGYVANWRAILVRRNYWEMFTAPSLLEHTWSLAIEEQFYIVWPLAVAALLGVFRGRVRAVFLASVLLAVASAAAMGFLYDGGDSTRVYLGTDTRGAAILVGAALATSGLARAGAVAPQALDTLGIAASIVLGAAWFALDGQNPALYRGGFWVVEIAAAVLILCCVRRKTGLVTRALSVAPIRALGVISYGVYLWHWPVSVVLSEGRVGASGVRLLAVRLGVTLVIATLSYRFLERPIRQRGLAWGRPLIVVPCAFALAVACIVASTRARAGPSMTAGADVQDAATTRALPSAAELPPGTLRVLVVGDSVGVSLGRQMRLAQAGSGAVVAERAVPDCSILDGVAKVHAMDGRPHGNGDCAARWTADVAELHPDATLVVLGGGYFSTVKSEGRWRSACDRTWRETYAARLAALLLEMAPNGGRRLVALAAYPVGEMQKPPRNDHVDCYNATLRQAAMDAGADLLDMNAHLCPGGVCTLTSHEAPIRPDGMHFVGPGAGDTARWVLGELRAN